MPHKGKISEIAHNETITCVFFLEDSSVYLNVSDKAFDCLAFLHSELMCSGQLTFIEAEWRINASVK